MSVAVAVWLAGPAGAPNRSGGAALARDPDAAHNATQPLIYTVSSGFSSRCKLVLFLVLACEANALCDDVRRSGRKRRGQLPEVRSRTFPRVCLCALLL